MPTDILTSVSTSATTRAPRVVIAYEGFGDIHIERSTLAAVNAEIIHTGTLDTPEAQDAAAQADALMVTIQKVTADLIAHMARCKIVSRVGTGLDAIDLEAATQRGIWVTNVPDYSVDEVSTHAIALMLMHARRLPLMLEMVRQRGWYDHSMMQPIQRLAGQIFGVLGFGRIGRATAIKAHGLGLEVLVCDPYVNSSDVEAAGAKRVDLDTMLRRADFISLHSPLTRETDKIINATTLALMKPTAFLINAARGGLIDEMALLEAVQTGRIAGAALDVLAVEPPPPDHPFRAEPRIILTPHVAWSSVQALDDVKRKAAEDVVRVLRGERPRVPVNQPVGLR